MEFPVGTVRTPYPEHCLYRWIINFSPVGSYLFTLVTDTNLQKGYTGEGRSAWSHVTSKILKIKIRITCSMRQNIKKN